MERRSRKPPRLRKGQAIGIVAPAGPVSPSEIQPGIDLLEAAGYKVISSPHLYGTQGYVAGDDGTRLEDLHSMFSDGHVRAIFCARGGYGSLRLLEKMNFELIRRNPKILLGYSDITALLLAIYKETGLVTFHGAVVTELAKNRKRNLQSFLDLVSSKNSLTLNLTKGMALIPGKANGTLLGGNLSLICHLTGTPFIPSLKNAILFIEDKGEPLYRIDRMLTHLRLSGLLQDLSALIVGTFKGCGDTSSLNQVLADTLLDLKIPVIRGLPVGHGRENHSLPIGVQAEIDTKGMTLTITESCTQP
jgi:muramoyltetrapeptide carboxypeptidase